MCDKKYSLYKRIMKRDPKAIAEIETLEEAKEIIKMIMGNTYLNGEMYNSLSREALDNLIEKVKKDKNDRIEPIYLPREYVESHHEDLQHLIDIGAVGVIGLKE